MEINKLPIGTKLIWDAPLPYEGYTSTTLVKGKVLYTAIVSERDKDSHPRGTRIKTFGSNNWMGNENEFLRKPTKKELTEYKWPKLNYNV